VIIHFNPPKILSPAGKREKAKEKIYQKISSLMGKIKKGAFKSPC